MQNTTVSKENYSRQNITVNTENYPKQNTTKNKENRWSQNTTRIKDSTSTSAGKIAILIPLGNRNSFRPVTGPQSVFKSSTKPAVTLNQRPKRKNGCRRVSVSRLQPVTPGNRSTRSPSAFTV